MQNQIPIQMFHLFIQYKECSICCFVVCLSRSLIALSPLPFSPVSHPSHILSSISLHSKNLISLSVALLVLMKREKDEQTRKKDG